MIIYSIPDIRLLWSRDSGFLNQFADKSPTDDIVYKVCLSFKIDDDICWIINF